MSIDLLTCTPGEVRALIEAETDPTVLRALVLLEEAAHTGDLTVRVEAAGLLCDLVVLERGAWG